MVNWSKNKLNEKINTRRYIMYLRVMLFIFLCSTHLTVNGQRFLNERFTCVSYASACNYLIPFGISGGFIMAGNAIDSASGLNGIYLERRNVNATVIKHNFFSLPSATKVMLATNAAITKVNDNKIVLVGTTEQAGCCKLGFLLEIDSNCSVRHYEDIYIPYCGLPDSFMYTAGIKYDGQGHLLVTNHVACSATDYIHVLMKYDTSYHQLWAKQYSPFALKRMGTIGLVIEDDGYTVFGGANTGSETSPSFAAQSQMFKIDTAGNLLWAYVSPLFQWSSYISDAIKTKDGGYIYLANGDAINTNPPGSSKIYLMCKNIMVKLDASHKEVWRKDLTSYYFYWSALEDQKLIELSDSSIIVQRWDDDSIGLRMFAPYVGLQKFTKDGNSVWRQRFRLPMDTPLTSSGGMYAFIKASNGDLIIGGDITDHKAGATEPLQRAWLIKTDSNGCMGPGTCEYVSVVDPPVSNAVVQVFPNPANDFITLRRSFEEPMAVQFIDLSGRIMQTVHLNNSMKETTIPIQQWPSGIYFFKCVNNAMLFYGKFIKR